MAIALRPAVLLIALASLLFIAAGVIDASGGGSEYTSIESYVLGGVNLLVAVLIARGNERILALRIGLAAFFMFERPVTAVAFGPKPIEGIAIHLLTAVVEGAILLQTMRVWRLGHSVSQSDLAFLTLPSGSSASAAAIAGPSTVPLTVPEPAAPRERPAKPKKERPTRPERPLDAAPPGAGWSIGVLALLLALALVGDALSRGIVPGVTVDLASAEWLGYLFALVLLVVASRAVHRGRFAVRLLLVLSLITVVERGFSPFALGVTDPASLALHAVAALLALGLALMCAASLRASHPKRTAPQT